MLRNKFIPILAVAVFTAVFTIVAVAQGAAGAGEPQAQASVVSSKRHVPPKKRVVKARFRPWAKPSPRQVREIIRAEARRYGIPAGSLARRVACESRYHWWASNGSYHGLLQFAPGTFSRGLRTLRSRSVTLVRSKVRKVRSVRITRFSDGRVEKTHGRARYQRLVVVYKGRLPRRPSLLHAWTQVRIGAQAIRGVSAVHSSEWGCSA
jgi:hypothetical protein